MNRVITTDDVHQYPPDWLIFNAPRPLIGHHHWEDPSKHLVGWWWAAIDSTTPEAEGYIKECLRQNAYLVIKLDFNQWWDLIRKHRARLLKEYKDVENFIKDADDDDIELSLIERLNTAGYLVRMM